MARGTIEKIIRIAMKQPQFYFDDDTDTIIAVGDEVHVVDVRVYFEWAQENGYDVVTEHDVYGSPYRWLAEDIQDFLDNCHSYALLHEFYRVAKNRWFAPRVMANNFKYI